MGAPFAITFLLLSFASTLLADNQICYWQYQSTIAKGLVPCANSSAAGGQGVSCCEPTSYCLNNGVCFDPDSLTVYRGGCTDSSWLSNSCANLCEKYGISNSGLWPCGDNYFACDPSGCNSSSTYFLVNKGSLEPNAAVSSALGLSATSAPATTAPVTTTATATVTLTPSASPTSNMVPKSEVAAVGGGVGGGMAVLLIIALILLYLEHKKRRNAGAAIMSAEHAPALGGYRHDSPSQGAYYDKSPKMTHGNMAYAGAEQQHVPQGTYAPVLASTPNYGADRQSYGELEGNHPTSPRATYNG